MPGARAMAKPAAADQRRRAVTGGREAFSTALQSSHLEASAMLRGKSMIALGPSQPPRLALKRKPRINERPMPKQLELLMTNLAEIHLPTTSPSNLAQQASSAPMTSGHPPIVVTWRRARTVPPANP